MSVQLHLHCRQQPDVVERILRVIRHRGFTLNAMSMAPSSCGEKIEVAVTVSSSRPLHLLTAQLKKLHDVLNLSVCDESLDHAGISS
ncbi:acetolactate synthase 2 small subunit [Endozoicomonas ascidiicola]|uniref:acetolactate synthase 2 small subunit n=1 Tax=Endozoicomonas ascidiicola TaxID=1698521 RepID=UPI000829F4AA|nr:acetolactate synthase 2 small subunit [Endozoicomonas ascidiicola]